MDSLRPRQLHISPIKMAWIVIALLMGGCGTLSVRYLSDIEATNELLISDLREQEARDARIEELLARELGAMCPDNLPRLRK